MLLYALIALGGAIGSVSRFALNGLISSHVGETFPWGTLVINVTGSFVIGFFAMLTGTDGRLMVGSNARQFFMTGVCGGYTTFSSFSWQTLTLVQDGEWLQASGYVFGSVISCLVAVYVGAVCANLLNR